MPQPRENTELQLQKDESGLVALFNLSRLMQTVDSIAVEAKDEEEMLQLTVNALCIFTGWPLGHIFLRDATHRTIFRCGDTHYVKYDLYMESHQVISSHTYDESNPIVKQMTTPPTPFIYRGTEPVTLSNVDVSFQVLIPIVSRGELFGFFELVALEGDEEPNQHLMQVFHQIGYRIGSVLDSTISSENLEIAKANDEAILSSIGEGLVVADSKEAIVLVNKAAVDMLKWKAHEMVGKPWFDVLKPIDRDGKVLPIEKRPLYLARVSGKKVFSGQYEFLREDKTKFPVVITATPVLLKDESMGAIIVFRDATQEREIEQMRKEMISLTSHQLKSPLTAIRGFTELLKDRDVSPEAKDYLDKIDRSAKTMVELIGEILNISKIEQGSIEMKAKLTQLEEIVDNAIKELSPLAKKRKVAVEFVQPSRPLGKVNIDPIYIRQAVENIISNAIKYTKDKVTLSLDALDGKLQFSCTDNGIGIPQDEQSHIFTKFYRASNAKQTGTEGTGLGLSIVQAIVERSGGRVWFESKEGKGTTFYVTLPLPSG